MTKTLNFLAGAMLVMAAILFLMNFDVPKDRLRILLSPIAVVTCLAFFPYLAIWSFVQQKEVMSKTDRIKLALVGITTSAYAGLLFTTAYTLKFHDALGMAKVASGIALLFFAPWLIARFDHRSVRWFMGSSFLFHVVSAV